MSMFLAKTAGLLLAFKVVEATVPASPSLEKVLADVASQVTKTYGNNMSSILEALVCRNDRCTPPMHELSDAGFMRAVFTAEHQTAPSVGAYVNLTVTPATMRFEYHTDPFVEDNFTGVFPPASNVTFETAWTLMQSAAPDAGVYQVTWRRPLQPCVSEDLFQFNLDEVVPGHSTSIFSVGSESKLACYGFVTKQVDDPTCTDLKPDCITSETMKQNSIHV